MLHELQAMVEQITSLLLALGALAAAGTALWQSFRNRKRITALHRQVNARMDEVERRTGHDRRLDPRDAAAPHSP